MRLLLVTVLSTLLVASLNTLAPTAAGARDKGKSDCRKGGWKELVRQDGTPFANQGECVTYAAKGNTPRPPEVIYLHG